MKKILSFVILVCFVHFAYGQIEAPIVFKAKKSEGKVILRWAANNPTLLKHGQEKGFKLIKIWNRNDQQKVEERTFFLKPNEEWETNKSDNFGFKAAKEIYTKKQSFNLESFKPHERFSIQNNLFSLSLLMADLSQEAANYQGLGFVDTDIIDGESYFYSLQINDVDSIKNTFPLYITANDKNNEIPISTLSGIAGDSIVKLTWNLEEIQNTYAAYYLEKSIDLGKSYSVINEAPYIPLTNILSTEPIKETEYKDSLEENGQLTLYRIYGIDYFGEKGPYSEVIKLIGKPKPLGLRAEVNDIFETENKSLRIRWHLQKKHEEKIKNFYILRSIDGKKSYQRISEEINKTKRTWFDTNPEPVNFYKIILVDQNDYHLESTTYLGQLVDNTPPAKPTGLRGTIDTLGEVKISWTPNAEEDLGGYHVFYSNTKKGEYSILTNSSEVDSTNYTDSIYTNTLAKKIFYKIMAIDFRGNQSVFSDPLELDRPDLIPPVPALFKKFKQELDQVYFRYTNSSSQDLKSNSLQRRLNTENEWITLLTNDQKGTTNEYVDTSMNCALTYQYRIISEDQIGYKTVSDTLTLKCIDSGKRPPITDLKANLTESKNSIQLKWSYPLYTRLKSIMIFRSVNGSKMNKIKQFWPNEIDNLNNNSYLDKEIEKNKEYSYLVIMRFVDNSFTKSNTSESISIKK